MVLVAFTPYTVLGQTVAEEVYGGMGVYPARSRPRSGRARSRAR